MSKKTPQVVEPEEAFRTMVEGRRKRRVRVSLPIVVKGRDLKGNPFEESTESINFSAGGTCFFLERRVRVGSALGLLISLPPDWKTYKTIGRVTRIEKGRRPQAYKFAVKFNHVR
jgi:hypothetical protein